MSEPVEQPPAPAGPPEAASVQAEDGSAQAEMFPVEPAPDSVETEDSSVVAEGDAPPEAPPAPEHRSRLPSILESLLFAADHPLTAGDLAELVGEPERAVIDSALALLGAEWSPRGIQLHHVAGGWQFRTHPQNAAWVQKLVAQKPVRLSRPLLETLAIVAYRQPITRPEIDEIRGVDSGGTLKVLLERSLTRILGKKEEPGRPLLYGTTREFLEFFNLRDLKELPTLREFHELSDEHRAQVEALSRAARPGTIEGAEGEGAGPQPLARVELPDAPLEEDLSQIDSLIVEAEKRTRAAAERLGAASELSQPPAGAAPAKGPVATRSPGGDEPDADDDRDDAPADTGDPDAD